MNGKQSVRYCLRSGLKLDAKQEVADEDDDDDDSLPWDYDEWGHYGFTESVDGRSELDLFYEWKACQGQMSLTAS